MGRTPLLFVLACAFGSGPLADGEPAARSTHPNRESAPLPSSDCGDGRSASTWNAEELLRGLLDLIKSSRSIKDFSSQRVSEHLQRPAATFAPGHYGYGGKLTGDWSFSFEIKHANTDRARLDLDFIDTTPEQSSTATDICQVDFDRVSSELERAGFSRSTTYGEHGRIIDDRFDRPGLNIKVATMGEAPEPREKATHSCVLAVTVQ